MSNNIKLKRGLDIPIKGAADRKVKKTVVPDIVALKPTDFKGLVPRLLVKEGDRVLAGSPVFADKMSPRRWRLRRTTRTMRNRSTSASAPMTPLR